MVVITKSGAAARTFNPIRRIVDRLTVKPNPTLSLIPLSIGDPTVFGNFSPPSALLSKLVKLLHDSGGLAGYTFIQDHSKERIALTRSLHGYPHSCGTIEARSAVAAYVSEPNQPAVSHENIILTCGCSQALDLAISVLADPGKQHILLPRPGFSLYRSLCASKGIHTKYYDLLPNNRWQADIAMLKEQIVEGETAALLVNNPSNPCGSNFSREHVEAIVQVCEEKNLPIIADEIYANMHFRSESSFHSFASVSAGRVPVLQVGGLAKRFMVPGWRMGWVALHDSFDNKLKEVREGLQDLSTLTLGPSSVLQAIVPFALQETPESYHKDVIERLSDNASIIAETLQDTPGLQVIPAEAAMYILVGIDTNLLKVADDVEFSTLLLQEQSVFVLPGQCFQIPNFFRIVITPPPEKLLEACKRIKHFCEMRASRKNDASVLQ